jgi:Caspase domain
MPHACSSEKISFAGLCIGISAYPSATLLPGEDQLRHPASDAIRVADWLKSVFGEEGIVECLTDSNATKAKILSIVETLSKYKLVLFIFYFSGHGRFASDSIGLVVFGHSHLMTLLDLKDCEYVLARPGALRTLAIVDACNSARVMQGCGFFSVIDADRARVFLAASDSIALESQRLENSLFTTAFVDAVQRIKGKRDGVIDVEAELFPTLSFQTAAGAVLIGQGEQAVIKGGTVKEPLLLPQRPGSEKRLARQLATRAIRQGIVRIATLTIFFLAVVLVLSFVTTYHIALNSRNELELQFGLKELSFMTLGYPVVSCRAWL